MGEVIIDASNKSVEQVARELFSAIYGASEPVIRELGLVNKGINEDDSLGPYFTGWKGSDSEGYCGQICYLYPERKHGVYITLPGGECGHYLRGERFNVGSARIWTDLSVEESREMLSSGLEKLKQLMEEHRDAISEPTAT